MFCKHDWKYYYGPVVEHIAGLYYYHRYDLIFRKCVKCLQEQRLDLELRTWLDYKICDIDHLLHNRVIYEDELSVPATRIFKKCVQFLD